MQVALSGRRPWALLGLTLRNGCGFCSRSLHSILHFHRLQRRGQLFGRRNELAISEEMMRESLNIDSADPRILRKALGFSCTNDMHLPPR